MTQVFTIDMLPGFEGDSFWIEYGEEESPHRILIDGGRGKRAFTEIEARVAASGQSSLPFELGMVTHVDADHIEGILRIFEADQPPLQFTDFWFNGFDHLDRSTFEVQDADEIEIFGAKQGETLTDALIDAGDIWNKAFRKFPVVTPDAGELPSVDLDGGMKVTVVSPSWPKLEKLLPVWRTEVEDAGLIPGIDPDPTAEAAGFESFGAPTVATVRQLADLQFDGDDSAANGSSIAVILEFAGKRALFLGDAHMDVIEPALDRFAGGDASKLHFDAVKISHHGSKGTVSRSFLEKIDCDNYLISTNGSRHKHPNAEAMARILVFGGEQKAIHFNYSSDFSEIWDTPALKDEFGYTTVFPNPNTNGTLRVDVGVD